MANTKKSMRMVYLETDSAGKSKRRAHSYTGLLPDADNASVKKAAKAIDDMAEKPATFVEVTTTEQLD